MIGPAKPFALLVLGAALVSFSSGDVELVKDLRTEPSRFFPLHIEAHLASGDQLFLMIHDSIDGGLWSSDGTQQGTRLVRAEGEPWRRLPYEPLGSLEDGRIFYFHGYESLYVSDGTPEGTIRLGDDLPVEERPRSVRAPFLPISEGRRLFAAWSEAEGWELWTTDGTDPGTRPLVSLVPGTESGVFQGLAGAGGRAYFARKNNTPAYSVPEELSLWTTDGTADGTRKVKDFGVGLSLQVLPWSGEQEPDFFLLFVERPDAPREYWRTDGTADGTVPLTSIEAGPSNARLGGFAPSGADWLLVVLRDLESPGGVPDCELWRSGLGGEAKLLNFTDFLSAPPTDESNACPSALIPVKDGRFIFPFEDGGTGRNFWVTDGTVEGTRFLADPYPGSIYGGYRYLRFGDSFAFEGRSEGGQPETIYVTDGTEAGTRPVTDQGSTGLLGTWGDRLLFLVYGEEATELWETDGTAEGKRKIADLGRANISSGASVVLRSRDRALLSANADIAESDWWSSDGTSDGTVPLDLSHVEDLTFWDSVRMFGDYGYFSDGWGRLFRTDGTEDGTEEVLNRPEFYLYEFSKIGPKFITSGFFGDGYEPWVTDGTDAGTYQLVDAFLGEGPDPEYPEDIVPNNSFPRWFTRWNDSVVFVAEGEDSNDFLWITDGTSQGTHRLHSPRPGGRGHLARISSIQPAGERLFFNRGDLGLWVTDGSASGSRQVLSADGEGLLGLALASYRGRGLVYDGSGFWLTDGTREGTRRIADLPEELEGVEQVTVTGQDFYFTASRGDTGRELWVSDGTAEGTRLVKDLFPGPEGSDPLFLEAIDGSLFFNAFDGQHGREPWVTDGTEEGTRLLGDLRQGPASSAPNGFFGLRDSLVFTAYRDDVGSELFRVDRDSLAAACRPGTRTLCLQEGRFSLSVDWRNQRTGAFGAGTPQTHSEDTGMFWFFNEENVELLVKLLDGRPRNEHFWAFAGALTDVETWVTVTDHETGETETFHTPPRQLCGFAETRAFKDQDPARSGFPALWGEVSSSVTVKPGQDMMEPVAGGACEPGPDALLLQNGRFSVEVTWETARQGGRSGVGTPVPGTDKSGYFWFFDEANLELVVKVLDGRPSNGRFWVLYGALSDVGYEIRVTDLETCASKTYVNVEGNLCGRADVQAF